MNIKFSFHNMPHSNALEEHARAKLEKVQALFKHNSADQPLYIEFFLNAQTAHVKHHSTELHVKTGRLNLTTHDTGADMYAVVDSTVDKMVRMIKKEKDKNGDKKHRVRTEKTAFAD